MNDRRVGPDEARGRGRGMEYGLLGAVLALAAIVFGGGFSLAGRTRALEALASSGRDRAGLEALASRVATVEGDLASVGDDRAARRRLDAKLAGMETDLASLKRDDPARRSLAAAVEEMRGALGSLRTELAQVKGLGEEAVKQASARPAAAGPGAADPARLARIEERLDALQASVSSLSKAPPPKDPAPAKIDENALRALVNQMAQQEVAKTVQAEVQKAVQDFFNARRGGQGGRGRPGGGGQ